MKKRLLATVLAGAMVLSMAACGSSNANKTESAAASETANASTEAGAEGGETQAAAQEGNASSELNIYMWQQYISDDLIKNFETENNCKVNLSYMSDNADAINKLTAGGGDEYDLIMTCDAYMKSLIAGDYVEKLNLDNIPNSSNINDTYWVSKGYCVPYLMNYIYVVYDSETCPVEIHSYNDLLQSGLKISTIDGARNLFPIALVALGYDPNSTNESEIAEAYEWLQKFNENVVAYGNAEQNLTNGTANVAVTYDGNASWAMKEKNTIKVADFTSDPIQLGIDLFVMPKGAKHVEVLIPFNFGIPGIKLGLANLVVVVALYLLNARQALMISVVRILLVSFTFGNMAALLYSITGGLLSFAVMVLCRRIKGLSTMSVSVAGGISHNIGQILVAVFVVKNLNLLFYLPVLMIAGIITGLLIGLVAGLIIPSVRKALQL